MTRAGTEILLQFRYAMQRKPPEGCKKDVRLCVCWEGDEKGLFGCLQPAGVPKMGLMALPCPH